MPALPHILLITADQMRADAMGCAGNAAMLTPQLDRLAREGTLCERAYCVNPVCTPSRAALLTGRYPHCTGAWNIGVAVKEDEVTLGDHLRPLGYRCVGNGKMHFRPQRTPDLKGWGQDEDPARRDRPRQRDGTYYGFDEVHNTEDNMVGEYLDWLRATAPEWGKNPHGNRPDGQTTELGSILPPELHQTHWVGERSVETIRRHDPARPLFMWTSFVDPHHPWNAPARYVDMYRGRALPAPPRRAGELDARPAHLRRQEGRGYWPGGGEEHKHTAAEIQNIRRNYYAMVTFIDEEVGRLRAALEARGMWENTLVVFTADHGELLGDHGLLYKGPWLYECLMRVPMILRGPGVPAGRRCDALMENADVLPTLLDLAGQAVPYGVQGRSLRPVLAGQAATMRDSAICSYNCHDRGINLKALRTARYKLCVFAGETFGELYDLERDPQELENRWADPAYAAVRAELHAQLAHRLMHDEDPLPERRCMW